MSGLKADLAVLLGKKEATYAVDPVPTDADNAFLVRNLEVNDLAVAYEPRDVVLPYHGNFGEIVTAKWSEVSFAVALAGSGTAGTAPKWAPALMGYGFSETLVALTSATYNFVSALESSVSYYYRVGGMQHKLLGWRGNGGALSFARGRVPLLQARGFALHVQATDTALGAPVFTGWQKPLAFNKANTTTFSLHGTAVVPAELSIELAVRAPFRDLPNSEAVVITGRRPTGRVTFQDNLVAAKDWQAIVKAETTGALAVVHGPATNQVKVDAPAVQLTSPARSNDEGILMRTLGMNLKPVSGNDELVITVL